MILFVSPFLYTHSFSVEKLRKDSWLPNNGTDRDWALAGRWEPQMVQ